MFICRGNPFEGRNSLVIGTKLRQKHPIAPRTLFAEGEEGGDSQYSQLLRIRRQPDWNDTVPCPTASTE